MSRSRIILPAVAVLGLVVFVAFLEWLLVLRYERGDVYPDYSTLRADPMGARAYFEALQGVPGVTAVRGFDHLRDEIARQPRTLFFLGVDDEQVAAFSKEEVAQLDDYVKNGGRIVLTYAPERADDDSGETTPEKKEAAPRKAGQPAAAKEDKDATAPAGPMTEEEKYERDELRKAKELDEKSGDPNPDPFAFRYVPTLTGLWGFGTDDTQEKDKNGKKPASSDDDAPKAEVLAVRAASLPMEKTTPWKSALHFVRLEPEWQVLYTAKEKPVLVRRAWGKGEIVVASDSYFLSDEALRKNRSPQLLSFVAGPTGLLLFDETHLGTEEQEGVMYFMNKFHLEGAVVALAAVLALFLWRNSVPLVPPPRVPARAALGGAVSGKDSRSGLVNLLRRNLGPAEILPAALAEWQRTVGTTQPYLREKAAAMGASLNGAEMKRPEQVVRLYHELREINATRKPSDYATKP